MSKLLAVFGSNGGALLGAGVVSAALLGGGAYIYSQQTATPVAVIPHAKIEQDAALTSQGEAEAVQEASTPQAPAAPEPPRFDEVRREPDGLTVLAGRAAPDSDVRVLLDGVEVGKVTADGGGSFATVAFLGASAKPQLLTLEQTSGDKVTASLDEIILAPVSQPISPPKEPSQKVADADPVVDLPQSDQTALATTAGAPLSEPEEQQTAQSAETAAVGVVVAVEAAAEAVALAQEAVSPTQDDLVEAADPVIVASTSTTAKEDPEQTLQATADNLSRDAAGTDPTLDQPQQDAGAVEENLSNNGEVEVAVQDDPIAANTAPGATAQTETTTQRETATQTAPQAAPEPTKTDQVQTANAAPEPEPELQTPVDPTANAPTPLVADTVVASLEVPALNGEQVTLQKTVPAQTPETTPEIAVAPAAPSIALLRSSIDGVELLQPARTPEVMSTVALDTISYSEVGNVQLAGRAQGIANEVRVYLDNTPIATLNVDATGRWRGDLPDVDTGIYTLRVDEVAADGKVTSRVETPFKRESKETLSQAAAREEGPIKAITVQKGATLWAIARERYGDPTLFVRVFEANSDAIKDPDLIYPGQVFDLPGE